MYNNKLIQFMSKEQKSLKEIAEFFKTSQISDKEIIAKTGVDKNVLYRIRNAENITLENYLKIRNAFPNVFNDNPKPNTIAEIPVLGQIVGEAKIKTLSITQPNSFVCTSVWVDYWQPIFAYNYNDNRTNFHGMTALITCAGIDSTKVTKEQCHNRMMTIYPKDNEPMFVTCLWSHQNKFEFFNNVTKEKLYECPLDNELEWGKFIGLVPISCMEFHPDAKQKIDDIRTKFDYQLPQKS